MSSNAASPERDDLRPGIGARIRRSLRAKQMLLIAAVVVLTTLTLTTMGYLLLQQTLRNDVRDRLVSEATWRQRMVSSFIDQQHERLALLSSRTKLRQLLERRLDGGYAPGEQDAFIRESRQIIVDAKRSTTGFDAIMITGPDGRVVTATDTSLIGRDVSPTEAFIHGRNESWLSFPFPHDVRHEMWLSGRMTTNDGRSLGVVIVNLDASPLFDLLTPAKTRLQSNRFYLTTRRGPTSVAASVVGADRRVAPLDAPALMSAASEQAVFVEGIDRDGRDVLVACSPVAFDDWALLAQVDAREAYAPIGELKRGAVITCAGVLLVALGVAYLLMVRQLRPIHALTHTAERIADGHLDARADVLTRDEVGVLAEVFNRMADELTSAQRRFVEAQHIARFGNWEWQVDTGRMWWSRGLYDIFGRDPASFVPSFEAMLRHVVESDRPELQRQFDAMTRGGQLYPIEFRVVLPDGSTRTVTTENRVEHDEAGRVVRWVGVAHDVTDQRRAEQARAALEAELQHAKKIEAVGTFASGIAHDFSNLLTAAYAYIEDVRRHIGDPRSSGTQQVQSSLRKLESIADEATGLTRSLLTFTRRETTQKEPIDLVAAVSRSAEILRRMMPATIKVTCVIREDGPIWIHADSVQVQQVLLNLAINSADAMPDGGELTIAVASRPTQSDGAPGGAELRVTDTGVGMSPARIARIFEPFYTTKPRGQGTGLGLAIVHGIVTDHGGEIGIESTPGKGTSITVTLPGCEPPKRKNPAPAARPVAGDATAILIAEDHRFVRELIATAVENAGYLATAVADGNKAIEAFEAHHEDFGLSVLDVDMPHRSGVDCARRFVEVDPTARILLITGRPEQLDGVGLPRTVEVMGKPFEMSELIERIQQILNRSKPRVRDV